MNILISTCLIGKPVRYDGHDLLIEHPLLKKWQQQNRLIPVCPEIEGGLAVPRAPAEIVGGDGHSVLANKSQLIDKNGQNVTHEFVLGAQKTLQIAKDNNCIAAILTERSPSCGSNTIYDGSFSRIKKSGMGVTSALLTQHGIRVFNQDQLEKLEKYLHISSNFSN